MVLIAIANMILLLLGFLFEWWKLRRAKPDSSSSVRPAIPSAVLSTSPSQRQIEPTAMLRFAQLDQTTQEG
jgi:hypothetical protein